MNLIFWMLARATGTVTGSLQSSVTYAAPSGAGNNITFTFDQPYFVQTFANGDSLVTPFTAWDGTTASGGDGTVTINSISPATATRNHGTAFTHSGTTTDITLTAHKINKARVQYSSTGTLPTGLSPATDYWVTNKTANSLNVFSDESCTTAVSITGAGTGTHTLVFVDGMHGYELNPASTTTQGFDSALSDYGYNYDSANTPKLPFVIDPSAGIVSVVKSVSKSVSSSVPLLQFNAVLTVSASTIVNSGSKFRPAYFGTDKRIIPVSAINTSGFGTAEEWTATSTFASIAATFAYLRMDHLDGYACRYIHATDNYISRDYGAEIAIDNSTYITRMLSPSFSTADTNAMAALHAGMQHIIDLAGCGIGGHAWSADGGHNVGRKAMLLFAEKVVPGYSSFFRSGVTSFQEDGQTYIPSNIPHDGTRSARALFGRVSDVQQDQVYWNAIVSNNGAKDQRDPYQLIDGSQHDASISGDLGIAVGGEYQGLTGPCYRYNDSIIRLLDLGTAWNGTLGIAAAPFEYAQRWRDFGGWAPSVTSHPSGTYMDYAAPWTTDGNRNINYGDSSAPSFPSTPTFTNNSGRDSSKHGAKTETTYFSTELNNFDNLYRYYNQSFPQPRNIAFSYAENQIEGATVGTVTCYPNYHRSSYTYAFKWADTTLHQTSEDGYYSIGSTTGIITITAAGVASAANDYETASSPYNNTVQATDTVTAGVSTATVAMTVNDVLEGAPVALIGTVTNRSTTFGTTFSGNHGTAGDQPSAVVIAVIHGTGTVNTVTFGPAAGNIVSGGVVQAGVEYIGTTQTGGTANKVDLYGFAIASGTLEGVSAYTVTISGGTAFGVSIFTFSGSDRATCFRGTNSARGGVTTLSASVTSKLGDYVVAALRAAAAPTGTPAGQTRVATHNTGTSTEIVETVDTPLTPSTTASFPFSGATNSGMVIGAVKRAI